MAQGPGGRGAEGAQKWAEPERIAVVFVHGQGEQTPMTDVVALAESVWRTDPRAVLRPQDAQAETNLAETYSVPVYDQDFSDQRRIVTREVAGRRVDFYQFYWADLMKGNRFRHLWAWFAALMTRAPSEIPPRIWPIRQTAMFLALGIGVWGALLALLTSAGLVEWASPGGAIAGLIGLLVGGYQAISAHLVARRPADKAKAAARGKLMSAIGVAIALGVLALLAWLLRTRLSMLGLFVAASIGLAAMLRFWRPPADWGEGARRRAFLAWMGVLALALVAALGLLVSGGQVFQAAEVTPGKLVGLGLFGGAVLTLAQIGSPRRRAASFQLGLALLLVALAAARLPTVETNSTAFLTKVFQPAGVDAALAAAIRSAALLSSLVGVVILGAAGWWLNRSFLAPVMADSARMFSNSPVNIPNQNAIRERGMKLLRDLHAKGTKAAPDGEPPYARIIVLAHSLGTVVAYRLLAHYWGAVHRTLASGAATAAEATALDAAAARIDPLRAGPGPALTEPARVAEMPAWRAAVRGYWKAINPAGADKSAWRVSDFVTIGSPLTYAALLMEENDRDFSDQVSVYKRYPTAPPQPTSAALRSMFNQHGAPHHGAMFAATCWTNLYFPNHGLTQGDLIGGPLHEPPPKGLGPGVIDVDLDHDNSVQGFTHSEYWRWPDHAKRLLRPFPFPVTTGSKPPPPHVAAMRDALNLFGDGIAEDAALLDPKKFYPNSPLPAEDIE